MSIAMLEVDVINNCQ